MKNIITAEKIYFGYSEGNFALKDFSIQLSTGGMTGLIGPNGAGKSTALKILSGYITPSTGEVFLNNNNIDSFSGKERAKVIAVVEQNIFTPLPFTVRQIVEMGRNLRISRFSALKNKDISAIECVMDEMDVLQLENKKFNKLSGGEKQRVKIAAALAQTPEILLLDEPTSQLDMGHSIQLMKHLKKLNKEKNLSILLVSHDIQLIASFMQELVFLKNGRILASGTVSNILKPELIEKVYDCRVEIITIKDTVQIIPQLN